MIAKTVFAFLPLLVYGDINVDVTVAKELRNAAANAFGERIDIISPREQSTFQISEGDLKVAVGKLAGRRPDDVFLHSPTPWDDLYRKFNWNQVRTKLQPISTRVIAVRMNPVIIAQKHFVNNSPYSAKYSGQISQQVWTTVSTTSSENKDITVGQEVNYKVGFGDGKFRGATTFQFTHKWGESTTKTQSTIVSSGASITIELQPGQAANAVLNANQGSMDVEVEYEVSLSGDVACNYGSPHNGHHFWAYDVNAVLNAAGKPTTFRSKEKITVGFYADERVVAYDGTGKQIA